MNIRQTDFSKLLQMEKSANSKWKVKITQEIERRLSVAKSLNRFLWERYQNLMELSKREFLKR